MIDEMDLLDRQLLDQYQRGLPVTPRPFQTIAEELGTQEIEVLKRLQRLQQAGVITRVGPVFNHARAGASTLAAMAVPEHDLQWVAQTVSSYEGVNHNYVREHAINLWFVVTAPDHPALESMIQAMETATGYPVYSLPMVRSYHIDLAFPLQWEVSDDSRSVG